MARLTSLALAASALAMVYGATPEAEACGGTFCDAGPQQMPVDQTGENILFVMRDSTVEAHVQIQYEGDPESFAWVVPVMALPEIEPGSDPLFTSLLDSTVPTFVLSSRFENCGTDDMDEGFGCGMADELASADGSFGGGGTDTGAESDGWDDGPEIVRKGVAGAFEYAVLDGGTVDGVVRWLDENGYAQDDEAPELLRSYLDKGFLFVAFKLRGGAGVEEIHPVVIRYEGTEPCVPIRLTRIAASDDMGIRAFFLGKERVVPTNYRAVEINPLRIDWVGLGSNYNALVTEAVDDDGSDGHGFVTEYAGSSDIVSSFGILDSRWDSSKFIDAEPEQVADELFLQGLYDCSDFECVALHPLVEGLLEQYLPRPSGISAEEFYSCVECYAELVDREAWDGQAFATDLEERIIGPAEHALDILGSNPYLTRMYTTMSPHEMTSDPLFHAAPGLPEVSNTFTATQVFSCEGPDYIEFDDGSRLAVAGNGVMPSEMPAAIKIDEVPLMGAPMNLVDRSAEVADLREAWNAEQGLGSSDEGCACRSRRSSPAGLAWMAAFVGLGLWARRRRGA